MLLGLHSRVSRSVANGPGIRSVVWTQGCTLACSGCFNPSTHPTGVETLWLSPEALADWVVDSDVQGLTVSGGEPFQQSDGVSRLGRLVREAGLSVVVLTGYTFGELSDIVDVAELGGAVDVLIAGRYQPRQRLAADLLGSNNKRFHFLTDVYGRQDFVDVPSAEVLVGADGTVTVTGIDVPVVNVGAAL